MNELEVHLVTLPPFRVASALGYGPSPELLAWQKILSWAGVQSNPSQPQRFFGFNNPNPSVGSPNYGYEQWITASPQAKPSAEVELKDFPGGLFAVTRCRLSHITETWGRLVAWSESGHYQIAPGQCLEECLTPEELMKPGEIDLEAIVFDLYLPVRE